jgi:hypothetical protein
MVGLRDVGIAKIPQKMRG